ncbi:MAG: nucleotidyltransferase family protein [Helcococcus sp.]|nr:nucleotidyltransferase family protein [Helcococcus sp.]
MKNIGIVAEYNPLHNGHIYHINKIKSKFPNSNIIVIMSGNYVQRGEPAIIDKFDRANLAIQNGCDLVIQLPTIASLQSANLFAFTAVNILDKLEIIDYISFGVESYNIEDFNDMVDFQIKNEQKINELQKKYIKNGYSYKVSYQKAINELDPNKIKYISKPNNTLAIQYIKSLKKINSDINYYPIIRNDGGYNSNTLDDFEFQSASTIRNLIKKNINFTEYAPKQIKYLLPINLKSINDYSSILNYSINIQEKNPENICGFEKGILNLLNSNLDANIKDAIDKSHNKRYTKSRLQRFVLNYLLDINNDIVNSMYKINYIYPLKFNKKGAKILKEIKDMENLNIITNFKDSYNLDLINKKIFDIEIKANSLYYINDKTEKDRFYSNIPFVN